MMRKIMREIMGDIEIIRSIWGMMKMMGKVMGEIIRSKTLTFEGCCREAVKQKTSMAMTVTVNLPSINGYARCYATPPHLLHTTLKTIYISSESS